MVKVMLPLSPFPSLTGFRAVFSRVKAVFPNIFFFFFACSYDSNG